MKTLNLAHTSSAFVTILAEKYSFHTEIVNSFRTSVAGLAPNQTKATCSVAEKEGYTAIIVSEYMWKYFSFDIEAAFKGSIYQTNGNSLLCVSSNRRDTRSAAERQSDYNFFMFKQIEEVENQLDIDTSKYNPDKTPCLFK